MEKMKDSKIYQKIKNRLFFINLLYSALIFIFIQMSGLSIALRDLAMSLSAQSWIANTIYLTVFSVGIYLLQFPLDIYEGFVLEHRFRLSNQKFSQWLGDDLKKAGLSFVLTLIAVGVVYFFLGRWPAVWWIASGVFWLFLTLFLAKITPNVIIPLFYKYSPIENENLRQRILELFQKCKLPVQDVYSLNLSSKTKKANAFICGLGKGRRVVLSDTLIADFSVSEIETVVAHEIGHHQHRDIVKMIAVNTLVTFVAFFLMDQFLKRALVSFGLSRMDDIAFFPMVALVFLVFGFCVMPLLNAYGRKIEVEADRFSLEITRNSTDFIRMMEKLGAMNLSDFEPSLMTEILFYDHPPIGKRIRFARQFTEKSEKGRMFHA